MLDQLEAGGVRLTAFELGNEINTSGYNGDIARPGSGRLLTVADLDNPRDPEAAVITAGFRNYAKIAAALKDLRDHSKLNQHSPIISAGIAKISGRGSKAEGGYLAVSLPERCHLRGHENILKRQLVHVGAFNLSLILRKLLGAGTPRELKNRAGEVFSRLLRFRLCLMTTVSPGRRLAAAVGQPRAPALRCRMPRHCFSNLSFLPQAAKLFLGTHLRSIGTMGLSPVGRECRRVGAVAMDKGLAI